MNPKTARRLLATHFEDPNGDIPTDIEKALTILEKNPELMAEYRIQAAIDKKAARLIGDIEIPEPIVDELTHAISAIPASRFRWNDPAMLAVAIGLALIIFVVAWDFFGRPASFPTDALEVASELKAVPWDKLEPANLLSGEMEDWFVLKGFDGFIAPGRLGEMPAASAAIIRSGSIPLAILDVPTENIRAAIFDSEAYDIPMSSGEWRFIQVDSSLSAAIRVEEGQCVLVVHPGSVDALKRKLE